MIQSIRAKLLVMMSLTLFALVSITIYVSVVSLHQLEILKTEAEAIRFAAPLQRITASLARHERLMLGTLGTAATRSADIEATRRELLSSSQELGKLANSLPAGRDLRPLANELNERIGAVIELTQNLPQFRIGAVHKAAFTSVVNTSLIVSNEFQILSDPDVDFVYMFTVLFDGLPSLVGSRAEMAQAMASYKDTQALTERAGIVALIGNIFSGASRVEGNVERIARAIEQAAGNDREKRGWGELVKVSENIVSLLEEYHRQVRNAAANLQSVSDLLGTDAEIVGNIQVVWTKTRETTGAIMAEREGRLVRRMWLSLGPVCALILAMTIGTILLLRTFSFSFSNLRGEMSDIAKGDLDTGVSGLGRGDEFGQMSEALEHLRQMALQQRQLQGKAVEVAENLRELGKKIFQSVDAIHVASEEISSGSTDLAARTEREAAALQEIVSVVTEVAATIANNSRISEQARDMSSLAAKTAEDGGRVVGEVISSIKAIESSSRRISEIIVVMEEIAFQTKLLALNAAVEAARAGESGKGFAVVAQEVRSLADRSRQASQQIRELINDASRQVSDGVERAGAAERALNEILGASHKVAEIAPEIAAAGREQARSIEEVQKAMTELDVSTQHNSALVEESSAAAAALVDQANALARLVVELRGGEPNGSDSRTGASGNPIITRSAPEVPPVPASQPMQSSTPAMRARGFKTVKDEDWEQF